MKIILTETQKSDLEKRHKSEKNGKIRDRIKAILLNSEGWSQKNISQALRINESTVYEHLNEYRKNGKLEIESGGSISKLSEEESKELELHLEENTYASAKEIVAYVKEKYKISYTAQGIQAWLARQIFLTKNQKVFLLNLIKKNKKLLLRSMNQLKIH